MRKIFITKANGKRVRFDPNKVIGTCIRAGATSKIANQIAKKIQKNLTKDSSTLDVYKLVLKELAKDDAATTHRYRLKESLMLLGPAGYRFEYFMSKVLENYGYEIEGIRKLYQGNCITHEIDISASDSGSTKILIECKYHNFRGVFTKLKDSLYTHARLLDLQDIFEKEMLISNTKMSDDTITYANCIGQKLLAWRYPDENSLEKLIQQKGLYPITILRLKSRELDAFSKNNIILAKELINTNLHKLSKKTNIVFTRLQRLQNLVKQIIAE